MMPWVSILVAIGACAVMMRDMVRYLRSGLTAKLATTAIMCGMAIIVASIGLRGLGLLTLTQSFQALIFAAPAAVLYAVLLLAWRKATHKA